LARQVQLLGAKGVPRHVVLDHTSFLAQLDRRLPVCVVVVPLAGTSVCESHCLECRKQLWQIFESGLSGMTQAGDPNRDLILVAPRGVLPRIGVEARPQLVQVVPFPGAGHAHPISWPALSSSRLYHSHQLARIHS